MDPSTSLSIVRKSTNNLKEFKMSFPKPQPPVKKPVPVITQKKPVKKPFSLKPHLTTKPFRESPELLAFRNSMSKSN